MHELVFDDLRMGARIADAGGVVDGPADRGPVTLGEVAQPDAAEQERGRGHQPRIGLRDEAHAQGPIAGFEQDGPDVASPAGST